MKLTLSAPSRADLAGGTLDIWPLPHLFPGSRTLNVAMDARVVLEMEDGREAFRISGSGDEGTFSSIEEICFPPFTLYGELFLALPPPSPVHIRVLGTPLPQSGLGGSSALAACVARGLACLRGDNPDPDFLIALCRDTEAAVMGYPTGIQDYYPSLFGGICVIEYLKGRTDWKPIPLFPALTDGLILYHTGIAHHSGANNWEVVRGAISDKTGPAFAYLKAISGVALRMEEALLREDLEEIGRLVGEEWEYRRQLHPAFNHPRIDEVLEAARRAGAYGAKGCGAAGGGTVAILAPPETKAAVTEALGRLPGRVLDIHPTQSGLQVQEC
jgi:D-glycero-alpha-D-manno-heptose-7-phosphate kinase